MSNLWPTYLFPFLTILGFLILYLTLNNLLPSFFKQKGKNLATKSDISEITKLVETVKQTFKHDTEKLKANLQVLTNVQVGLVSEERNAIIDYNEKYFKWLHLLTDASQGEIEDSDINDVHKRRRFNAESYANFLDSEIRFKLFVENQSLVEYADSMKIETLKKLSSITQNYLLNLKQNQELYDLMKPQILLEEQTIKHQEFLDKKIESHKKFLKEMVMGYKDIAPINRTFQRMCREYIYQLIIADEIK